VEAAKLLYKAEKERYRAERQERRAAREAMIASNDLFAGAQPLVGPSTPGNAAEAPAAKPAVHLVSAGNPKVGYPPLEMYSVPHRSNTYHGRPTPRRGPVVVETPAERTINRITRRLAAMGITDKAHPNLPAKIKEQLPKGTISEDQENNIVSTLVEELLFMSPKPAASGSALRDAEVPGAWP
jgi:Wiskott-Aldrich syndrome protein